MSKKEKSLHDKLDDHFKVTKQYLKNLKDDSTIHLIESHRAVGYDIEGNQEKFANDLADKLEKNLEKLGYDKGKMDDLSFKGVMQDHYGVTRDRIHEFVKAHGDQARDHLVREIQNSQSRLTQKQYGIIANEYIKTDKDRKEATKFLGLDKLVEFQPAALTNEHFQTLFLYHGETGKLTADHLPEAIKKIPEKKKKKGKK
jgi:hypothetical protein